MTKKNDPRSTSVVGFFMSLEFLVAAVCGVAWLLFKVFG